MATPGQVGSHGCATRPRGKVGRGGGRGRMNEEGGEEEEEVVWGRKEGMRQEDMSS